MARCVLAGADEARTINTAPYSLNGILLCEARRRCAIWKPTTAGTEAMTEDTKAQPRRRGKPIG